MMKCTAAGAGAGAAAADGGKQGCQKKAMACLYLYRGPWHIWDKRKVEVRREKRDSKGTGVSCCVLPGDNRVWAANKPF